MATKMTKNKQIKDQAEEIRQLKIAHPPSSVWEIIRRLFNRS